MAVQKLLKLLRFAKVIDRSLLARFYGRRCSLWCDML